MRSVRELVGRSDLLSHIDYEKKRKSEVRSQKSEFTFQQGFTVMNRLARLRRCG